MPFSNNVYEEMYCVRRMKPNECACMYVCVRGCMRACLDMQPLIHSITVLCGSRQVSAYLEVKSRGMI